MWVVSSEACFKPHKFPDICSEHSKMWRPNSAMEGSSLRSLIHSDKSELPPTQYGGRIALTQIEIKGISLVVYLLMWITKAST